MEWSEDFISRVYSDWIHFIKWFSSWIYQQLDQHRERSQGGDAYGIRTAPASQSIAVCLKAADPIFSFSSVQISPFFSGIKTSAWGQLLEGVRGALSVGCQKLRYVARKTIIQNITTPNQTFLFFRRWELGAGVGEGFEDGRMPFSLFSMDEDIWLWENMLTSGKLLNHLSYSLSSVYTAKGLPYMWLYGDRSYSSRDSCDSESYHDGSRWTRSPFLLCTQKISCATPFLLQIHFYVQLELCTRWVH